MSQAKIFIPDGDGAHIQKRKYNNLHQFSVVIPIPKKAQINKEREQKIFDFVVDHLGAQIVETFDDTLKRKLDNKEKIQMSEEELRSDTRCPICLTDFMLSNNMDEDTQNDYVKPIQLKCTHTLCRQCIMLIRAQKPEDVPRCPVCRKTDTNTFNLLDDPRGKRKKHKREQVDAS